MSKYVRQLRYYSEGHPNNYPTDGEYVVNQSSLSGEKFFTPYMPIIQLGIQTLPGTKFYLNSANNPIIIGNTGIYELDLSGLSEITSLTFEQRSIQAISDNNNAYLIIDIIYEDGVN